VINGQRGFFEGIDFSAMKSKGKPDLKRQETVLKALLTGNYRTLRLSGCAPFDQTALKKLLRNSPQLLHLDLSHCPKVDETMLASLSEASYLNHLRLSNLPQLPQISLPHPTLRHLQIDHCQGLLQLTLSHTLKTLSVNACWRLTSIEAKLFKTSRFRGARLTKQAPNDFVLERIQLTACPQLQPWWPLFAEWLKASPKNGIDLRKVKPTPTEGQKLALMAIASYKPLDSKK